MEADNTLRKNLAYTQAANKIYKSFRKVCNLNRTVDKGLFSEETVAKYAGKGIVERHAGIERE